MTSTVDTHPKWDRNHFMAFILYCAANADMDFSDVERQYILDKVGAETLKEIEEEYQSCTDYQQILLVQKYRELYFPTEAEKQALLEDLEDLFEIDGEYSQTEHNLFMMLRKIL